MLYTDDQNVGSPYEFRLALTFVPVSMLLASFV